MKCPFCYIKFGNELGDRHLWLNIFERISQWQLDGLTIGGGDAAKYLDAGLCRAIRELFPSTRIHVDTNGLALTSQMLELFVEHFDSMGLPIDGGDSGQQEQMRKQKRHLEKVLKSLSELPANKIKLRINTVVTKVNRSFLPEVGRIVSGAPVSLWSLYQFWPMKTIPAEYVAEYSISSEDFWQSVEQLKQQFPELLIDGRSMTDRVKPYFFVRSNGTAYTLSRTSSTEYFELGSIFEPGVVEKWSQAAPPRKGRGIRLVDLATRKAALHSG